MWNMNLPGAPMVDFHKFFDGENITQEDLVVWVNVGTHHLVCISYFSMLIILNYSPSTAASGRGFAEH
jgi:hypothetical protein